MEFSPEEFEEILNIFSEESDEIIHRLNNNMLTLEKNPQNKDLIIELFRDAHSLKGAARMIGFNDIQSVAHKIEDILGLAKDNKIIITSDITDVVCKAIDFINMSIQLSIKEKHEVKLNEYGRFLSDLDKISKNPQSNIEKISEAKKDETAFASENKSEDLNTDFALILRQNCEDINAKIAEIVYLLSKVDEKADLNYVLALIYDTEELSEVFKNSSDINLKRDLADILFKLEFVSKSSGVLTANEIGEIKEKFAGITSHVTELFNKIGLKVIDYKELAEKKTLLSEEDEMADEKSSFAAKDLIEDVMQLEMSPGIVETILEKIGNYINEYENSPIQVIFIKIHTILNVIKEQAVRPDAEILTILKQGIQLVEKLVGDSRLSDKEDIDLLIQSLDITEQMVKLKKIKNTDVAVSFENEKKEKEQPVAKTTDVLNFFESSAIKTLRVDTNKLDKLVNQIGEVIISKIKTQKHVMELDTINNKLMELYESTTKAFNYLKYYDRKLSQIEREGDVNVFMNFNKQFLSYFAENQDRLSEEIREIYLLHKHMQEDDTKLNLVVNKLEQMVKDIRLLPLATVFHMIPRMVRDIAKEKGKEIELSVSGSETNADKKIIEEIKTPLIHIIRNAIDHGIETPNERIAAGKDPSGKIALSSRHSENKIIIEIQDDGRGVNLEKIRQKAINQGLLTFDEINTMSDEQIMNLIFWPGFSTEDMVTDISGRGIGLDIVQTKISQLSGKVKVQSVLGQGAKVVIELPVTMATIKSFIIRLKSQYFAIPVSAIKSVIKVSEDEVFLKDGKLTIVYQQNSVPVFNMANALGFGMSYCAKNKKTILLIEAENNIVGFVVDELVGDQEILNKELSPPLFKLKNISGITTLVNGEICLIVNVSELLKTIMAADYKYISSNKTSQISIKPDFTPSDCSVLVVDDFMTTRIMLKNILSSVGYEVAMANDALEGLSAVTHSSFDLIVSDVEMPNMDGYEFVKKLKENELTSQIPVILVTSLLSEENKRKAAEAGVDIFISKNEFNQEYFLRSVEYLIERKRNG